ncbi:MAG TPA: hypothetical protein VF595_09375 [Tepidisphaeraceae bacterium]|jgi:hypothetical protein
MFGKLFSGFAAMMVQRFLTRQVAGRVAGTAVRGGGGIPGLLVWLGVSYAINRFMNRRPAAGPVQRSARRGRVSV